MAYIRKTKDEYQLYCNYGYGWEYILAEDTPQEAIQRKRESIENAPQYQYRIIKKRVPKE